MQWLIATVPKPITVAIECTYNAVGDGDVAATSLVPKLSGDLTVGNGAVVHGQTATGQDIQAP